MPLVAYAQNYMLQQWGTNHGTFMSMHTAYSTTGTNEVSGGTYARLATTWGTAAGGVLALASTPYTFNIPGSTTVAFLGFWDALSSGNFQGMTPLGGLSPFTFTAPSATSILLAPGTAYSVNQQVVVYPTGGSALPGGLTAGTLYYIVNLSTDAFSLSATASGPPITLSSDGSGIVQGITTEVFGAAGQYVVSSGNWTLV